MACEREALCSSGCSERRRRPWRIHERRICRRANWLVKTTETDLGRLLLGMSGAFNEAAPSSLGTILSLGHGRACACAEGKGTRATRGELAAAMRRGLDVMMEQRRCPASEKTVLVALSLRWRPLNAASEGLTQALAAAAVAAGEGAERTRGMTPRHGRAAYYGEKNLGRLDGGAGSGTTDF